MTDQPSNTSSPELPGDKFRKDGTRSNQSRWTGTQLKVIVTEADIDDAVRGISNHCMIAEAIKRLRPKAKNVEVDQFTARWTDLKKQVRYTFILPEPARKRLIYFDRGAKPKPFDFWLTGPKITQTHRDVIKNGRIKERLELGADKPASIAQAAKQGSIYQARQQDKLIGGRPQPLHKTSSSKIRRFGAKAFTWDEAEVVPYDPSL